MTQPTTQAARIAEAEKELKAAMRAYEARFKAAPRGDLYALIEAANYTAEVQARPSDSEGVALEPVVVCHRSER